MIRYYGAQQQENSNRMNEENLERQGMVQGRNIPVIPLPNPGEGGPVYEEPEDMTDMMPGVSEPDQGIQIPIIPLPNPGEGNITFPNPSWRPQPVNPEIRVRFVNAANGYEMLSVYLNSNLFANRLAFKETTDYMPVRKGESIVSLVGQDGYLYYQGPWRFNGCRNLTILIINTGSNLELLELPEVNCK